ncbi:nuclear pore complex protein Nup50 [Teleopsis dalmanni]|uniref:nuclear pore complex protein Nup50 n=1 Tax=Teleopsis dalmanni TaxID=139649 RepID=UPI0018CF8544|nr:nuclear pore complex protein Nup50 [Teleopsis dalmanni]
MTAKRQATSELNHDNWDEDDKVEERGQFRTASEDELKNRIIKKARRKNVTTENENPKSIFSGFGGFGSTRPATSTSSAFSFLSNLTNADTNANKTTTNVVEQVDSLKTSIFAGSSSSKKTHTDETTKPDTDDKTLKTSIYHGKLKGLNQAVAKWIKQHVDENPLCILTPIFKDYEKYMVEIEKYNNTDLEKNANVPLTFTKPATDAGSTSKKEITTSIFGSKQTSSETTKANGEASAPAPAPSFSFGLKSNETSGSSAGTFSFSAKSDTKPSLPETFTFGTKTNETATSNVSFNFGANTDKSPASQAKGFSFAQESDEKPKSLSLPTFSFGKPLGGSDDKKPAGFSFSLGATPFTFGNIQPPAATTDKTNDEEDEDDEPPKVEFKQVVEEDAIYSKKCKVFIKKEGNYTERGVGTLYIKAVDENKKQLIVRADTSLGNVLVNLILNSSIPAQRLGKNNVMMVCLPTPEMTQPTSLLLRVKTGEEADDLLENIEKHKK